MDKVGLGGLGGLCGGGFLPLGVVLFFICNDNKFNL